MTKPFVKKTYYAMTLDPVHVGTGGYRLGRVDNTITRE
ncbi:MAG: type III-B CRISPR module RAMP protein Cmr4, partial [Nitrospirae bacterium CG17_big_fil_post_rev_8_21_14_2_50_50_9]